MDNLSIAALPDCLKAKYDELIELCEKHPDYIPLPEVAKFLHVKSDGLRYGIEQKNIDFGICWALPKVIKKGIKQVRVKTDISGSRAFSIPTLNFYLWYTRGGYIRTD